MKDSTVIILQMQITCNIIILSQFIDSDVRTSRNKAFKRLEVKRTLKLLMTCVNFFKLTEGHQNHLLIIYIRAEKA